MIFEKSLFKFMFFDQYLNNNGGEDPIKICNDFCNYGFNKLTTIPNIENTINDIKNIDYMKIFLELFSDPNNYHNKFTEYVSNIDNIKNLKFFLLLSGYIEYDSGHAVNFIIEQQTQEPNHAESYSLYIINSGEGIDNHGTIIDNIGNVVIKFSNLTILHIYNLFLLTNFFNLSYNLNIKKTLELHKMTYYFNKQQIVINNDTQFISSFESDKKHDESTINFFYRKVFELIGTNYSIEKKDKLQLSCSCSYFSVYYSLCIIIKNEEQMNILKEKCKNILIKEYIDEFDITYNKITNKHDLINSSLILLKDLNNFELKNTLSDKIHKIIYNYDNCFIGTFLNYESNKNKLLDFLNMLIHIYNKTQITNFDELYDTIILINELSIQYDIKQYYNKKYYNNKLIINIISFINMLFYKLSYKLYKNYNSTNKIEINSDGCNLFAKKLWKLINIISSYVLTDIQIICLHILNNFLVNINLPINLPINIDKNNKNHLFIYYYYFYEKNLFNIDFDYKKYLQNLLLFTQQVDILNNDNIFIYYININNNNIDMHGIISEMISIVNKININNMHISTTDYNNDNDIFINLDLLVNNINNDNIQSNKKQYNTFKYHNINPIYLSEFNNNNFVIKDDITNLNNYNNIFKEHLLQIIDKLDILKFFNNCQYINENCINFIVCLLIYFKKVNIELIKYYYTNIIKKELNYYDMYINDNISQIILNLIYIDINSDLEKNLIDDIMKNIDNDILNNNSNNIKSKESSDYTVIDDKKFDKFDIPTIIYINNDDYYYKYLNEYYQIKIIDDILWKYETNTYVNYTFKMAKIHENKLYLCNDEFDESYTDEINSNLMNIIFKLNIINIKYLIWKYENNDNNGNIDNIINVEILNSNIQFIYDINLSWYNTNLFVNINDESYNINMISTINSLEKIWLLHLDNGFIVEKNNKKYLLLFINNNILNKLYNSDTNYWTKKNKLIVANKLCDKNKDKDNIDKEKIYLIEFHYTGLTFYFNSDDELMALFISLCVSRNIICINLLLNNYYNLFDKMITTYTYQLCFIRNFLIDIPYWILLNKNNKYKYQFEYEYEYEYKYKYKYEYEYEFNLRQKYLLFRDLNFEQKNLNFIESMDQYKLINKFLVNIKKYTMTINDNYNDKNISCYLRAFLSQYIFKCNEDCLNQNKLIYEQFNNYKQSIEHNTTIIQNIIKDIIISSQLTNIKFLYFTYYEYFYKLIIINKFTEIVQKIIEIIKNNNFVCGQILKTIEPLNFDLIYNIKNNRNNSEILFEIHSNLFIRTEQKKYLNLIYNDQNNDINNNIYEILMGKGKTSVITPLIILNNNYNSSFNKYNIILPEHLVNSSYNIINKYIEILDNYRINKNELFMSKNIINILSDSTFKYKLLTQIIENKTKNFSDILFIFDEIDSLINPMSSNLNIPNTNSNIDHNYKDLIIKIVINVIKINLKLTEQIFNDNDSIKIKNIYSIDFKKDIAFSNIISNKISQGLDELNNLTINQNYGFGIYTYENNEVFNYKSYIEYLYNNKSLFVAIPYKANFDPVNLSEFTDFETKIILTTNLYYNKIYKNEIDFFRIIDVILLFDDLINLYNIDNILITNTYGSLIEILTETKILKLIKNVKKISYLNECENILKFILELDKNQKIKLIDIYLEKIIFKKFFSMYLKQYNISTIDILNKNLSQNKILFSGTVNFNLPYDIINDINKDNNNYINEIKNSQIKTINEEIINRGEIMSAILGLINKKQVIYNYNTINSENDLIKFLFEDQNINNYDALIDAGGIFLKHDVNSIVKKIYDQKNISVLCVIKNEKKIFNGTEYLDYNNELFENIFIYYDHKNCIGIDFKQPYYMHGLVIVSKNNNLTNVSQAIYRLRNINIGHSIDYIIPINMLPKNTLLDLYNYLNENEIKMKNNTKYLMEIQCIKYIGRFKQIYDNMLYEEDIFYDTIKYNNKYLSFNEFIRINIINKINEVNNLNITLNNNVLNVLNNLSINIEKEKEIEIEKEISTTITDNYHHINSYIPKQIIPIDDYLNCNIYNDKITYLNTYLVNFYIIDYEILFSKYIIYLHYTNLHTYGENEKFNNIFKNIFANLYYLINYNNNKILILTYIEYLYIMNYIEHSTTTSTATINQIKIQIFNNFGNIVYKNCDDVVNDYINLLFFNKIENIIEYVDNIILLFINKDINFKINALNIILSKNYISGVFRDNILDLNIQEIFNKILNINKNYTNINKYIEISKLYEYYICNSSFKKYFTNISTLTLRKLYERNNAKYKKKYLKYKSKYLTQKNTIFK